MQAILVNLLYLTTVEPNRRTGGEIASELFINSLTECGCNVTVLGYQRKRSVHTNGIKHISVGIRPIETSSSKLHSLLWMMLSLISNTPYSVQKYKSSNYVTMLHSMLKDNIIDAIIIEHSQMAWLLRYVPENYPVVFIAHNVENELYSDLAKESTSFIDRLLYGRESRLMKSIEYMVASRARQIWTISKDDYHYFAACKTAARGVHYEIPPHESEDLPNGSSIVKSFDIGIIGTWSWAANDKGLRWFFDRVYPYLPENLSIRVAGKGADWITGRYENVDYCGFVDSSKEFMMSARVVAIPSISGGGIQIKTLEAISIGVSTVATPTALRGITTYPDSIIIAENPEQFAELLVLYSRTQRTDLQKISDSWTKKRKDKFNSDIRSSMRELAR